MTDSELIRLIEHMRDTMNSVATGGQRIDHVNTEYKQQYIDVDIELKQRGIQNTNSFSDLWDWHGRWSNDDMPTYRSRRVFLAELFEPLLRQVRDRIAGVAPRLEEPTGWPKVDRTIAEIRQRLATSNTEEQFQAIGLLCREALISLAQVVYDSTRHPSTDGVDPSSTDGKRMLEAYLATELPGGANEVVRRHTRAVVDLAVQLQHRRTATFREAALCTEATTSMINVIAIVSGRRDPDPRDAT